MCQPIAEILAASPIMVFPDCGDTAIVESQELRQVFDPSAVSMSATLEQRQPNGSRQLTVYMSRATLDLEGC